MDKEIKMFTTLMSILVLNGASLIHEDPTRESLWGKKVDFMRFNCNYWQLAGSIPPLKELSVCVDIQRSITTPQWTVFMYSHPDRSHVDISLEGSDKHLFLWLFGTRWSTKFSIRLNVWYSVCITWSEFALSPRLYINGNPVEIHSIREPLTLSSRNIASDGYLTLGASHFILNNEIHAVTGTDFQGYLTLFRMWSEELPASQLKHCVDGDVVRWDAEDWITRGCAPVDDAHLQCVWSLYAVQIKITIQRWDTQETIEYQARDLVHKWVREVLPPNMYIHTVLVSTLVRQNTVLRAGKVTPTVNPFKCSVYLNVIPGADVSSVQQQVTRLLKVQYPDGDLLLTPVNSSIHVSPVGSLPVVTLAPPIVATTSSLSTNPALTVSTTASTTDRLTDSSARTIPSLSLPTEGTVSESFFRVNLTVTLTGSPMNPEQKIKAWIIETLSKEKMSVLNFQFLGKAQSLTPIRNGSNESGQSPLSTQTSHTSLFQVQATTSCTIEQTMDQIHNSLEVPYLDGPVILDSRPEEILVSHIRPGQCLRQRHQTRQGLFVWPKISAQHVASHPCEGDPSRTARRQCLLASNNKARWVPADLQQCPYVVTTIPDLDDIEVTAENAEDVLVMIGCLLSNHTDLNDQELVTILNKLSAVVNVSTVTPALGKVIMEILSDILESDSNFQPVTNNILDITESIGDRLSGFSGESFILAAPGLAISVVNVNPDQFHNLTFGVSSATEGQNPEVYINQDPFDCTVAFISLPPSLQASFPSGQGIQARVQFQFFGTPALFEVPQSKSVSVRDKHISPMYL